MQNSTKNQTGHICPHCKTNHVETIATAPYVRGFLVAFQIGSKTIIGCTSCVKRKLFNEVGLSMLLGWLSITALIINPFLILYNLIQGFTVGPKPNEVNQKLRALGIPTNPQSINLTQVGYSLAAAMIKADGKVDPAEINIAELIGSKIFPDFDRNKFRAVVESKNLPNTQSLTALLKDLLNEEGKTVLFKYLTAIAHADGHVDANEKAMLLQVALGLGLDLQNLNQAMRA